MSENTNPHPGPWRHSRPAWLDEPVVPGLGTDALGGMDADQIQHRAEAARQRQRGTRAELLAQRVDKAAPAPKPAPEPVKATPTTRTAGGKAGKPSQPLKKRAQAAAHTRRGQSATPAPDRPSDRRTAPQEPEGDGLATPDDLAELLARRPDPSRIYRF